MTSVASDTRSLTRPDLLGPVLCRATGDDRWRQLEASLITGGKSNLTYLLRSPAGELIMRRPPSGMVLATAHDMKREVRVQRALAGSAVPVPEIVLYDDGDLLGAPFYVMARVSGLVIRDTLPPGFAHSALPSRVIPSSPRTTCSRRNNGVEPMRSGSNEPNAVCVGIVSICFENPWVCSSSLIAAVAQRMRE